MQTKYESPFPDKKITGKDFNELVEYVNSVIEKSSLNETKQLDLEEKLHKFNVDSNLRINTFKKEMLNSKFEFEQTVTEVKQLNKRLDDFYAKIIEIVGIFIAVFSFIITGIQISIKVEGATFIEKLINSTVIFLPVTVCIIILLLMIKLILKR